MNASELRAMIDAAPHELEFDAEAHRYSIGELELTSVTTFVKRHFAEYDPDANAIRLSQDPRKRHYFGRDPADIVAEWAAKGEAAAALGTELHLDIECWLEGRYSCATEAKSPVFSNFMTFWEALDVQHVYAELQLYDQQFEIAGTCDEVAMVDGKLTLIDWKHTKAITKDGFGRSAAAPIDHLSDARYWVYALQLNMYALLFYRRYNLRVDQLMLVNLKGDAYVRLDVPWLRREVNDMIKPLIRRKS